MLDRLAADFGQFALQITDAGFTGVVTDNIQQHRLTDGDLFFSQAMLLHLLGLQISLGDIEFFILGITGDTDDFHAVQQGAGDIQ